MGLSGFTTHGSKQSDRHAAHESHTFSIGSTEDEYLHSHEKFEPHFLLPFQSRILELSPT